jgi:galactokinase
MQACWPLDDGNIELLGKLMFETHRGLSKYYEVSCEELDFLVDLAKEEKSAIGSRLMVEVLADVPINLIKKGNEVIIKEQFAKDILMHLNRIKIYDAKISNGTSVYNHN